MTGADIATLKIDYPELPKWIAERDLTMAEARQLLELRRAAFPATKGTPT